MKRLASMMTLCLVSPVVAGGSAAFTGEPIVDRWNYPFNLTAGYRTVASVFGAIGQETVAGIDFDQRDAQFLLIFDVSASITPTDLVGMRVGSATLTSEFGSGTNFVFDATADARETYLDPMQDPAAIADADAGRPIEVFGVAFRNGFNVLNYVEGTPSTPGTPFAPVVDKRVRNAFPTDGISEPSANTPRDVSNSVLDEIEPSVWAIGQVTGASPGQQITSGEMTFELDVNNPDVQQYLQDAIGIGRVALMVTSYQPAQSIGGPGSGNFAAFVCKEDFFGNASVLQITLEPDVSVPGDVNGDGETTTADITLVVSNLGAGSPGASGTPGDANGDGETTTADITLVVSNLGAS